MEYNYLSHRKRERRGRIRESFVFHMFSELQNDPLYSGLVAEENSNNTEQGSKTGGENKGIGEDNGNQSH